MIAPAYGSRWRHEKGGTYVVTGWLKFKAVPVESLVLTQYADGQGFAPRDVRREWMNGVRYRCEQTNEEFVRDIPDFLANLEPILKESSTPALEPREPI